MSNLYEAAEQYSCEFGGVRLNNLTDAIHGLNGLVEIQSQCEIDPPEWWTEFHSGAVTSDLKVLSNELSGFLGRVEDQAFIDEGSKSNA